MSKVTLDLDFLKRTALHFIYSTLEWRTTILKKVPDNRKSVF